MHIIIIVLILLLIFLAILPIVVGRGRAVTLRDRQKKPYPKGISTRESMDIGGKKQYLFLVGENVENPVLLYLHGGPGAPEIGMEDFQVGNRLEEKFTVCYWEQRGAGLSYKARLSIEEMNLNLMIQDTLEVTKYLIRRFNEQQIYLMGHSWGSFLGMKVISKYPQYYKSYFGIGQISNQLQSEKLAYEYLLKDAKKRKDQKATQRLEKVNVTGKDFPNMKYLMSVRTKYMNRYGVGLKHVERYKMSELIKKVVFFKGYTPFDIIKYALGTQFSNKAMFHFVLEENLMETTTWLQVPVYFFQGRYDWQTSYHLAKEYYHILLAPEKGFYSFDHSAHSPNLEEKEKFIKILFSLIDKNEG